MNVLALGLWCTLSGPSMVTSWKSSLELRSTRKMNSPLDVHGPSTT